VTASFTKKLQNQILHGIGSAV